MNEGISISTSTTHRPNSPPPTCAICLGPCINRCFTNSCCHPFCFICLVKWSKEKNECALCKEPFESIYYNIKSKEEYDQHFLESFELSMNGPEYTPWAISVIQFRRFIYFTNLWVQPPEVVSGRLQDISSYAYKNYPATRRHLVPWLDRELRALQLSHAQVDYLANQIRSVLTDHWNIKSPEFRNLILPHLKDKTDHFIHEFDSFMQSSYDMMGYDRRITYKDLEHDVIIRQAPPPKKVDLLDCNTAEMGGRTRLKRKRESPVKQPVFFVLQYYKCYYFSNRSHQCYKWKYEYKKVKRNFK